MTILSTDIKLLESERMRDTADGGGRMTSNEIPDGVAGNVFPKVSRLDSVYGRVNLRKLYAAVLAANTDVYAGAHCVITDAPDNERIRCLLFSTSSHFDTRAEARDRIESYVVAGPESRYMLYGNQLIGQKAITLFARPDEPVPDVGDVLCLSAESGALAGTQQYVRITDVQSEVRTFEDESGLFDRLVVTTKISNPLRYTFTGDTMTRFTRHSVVDAARVRETQVADASTYYGIMPLEESADAGAMSLRVASAYDYLVPSATRETAVSLASIASAAQAMPTSTAPVRFRVHEDIPPAYIGQIVLPMKVSSGDVSLIVSYSFGTIETYYFDAAGDIYRMVDGTSEYVPTSEPSYRKMVSGSIDYETGIIQVHIVDTWAGTGGWIDVSCHPSVQVEHPAHTHAVEITLATRGTVYAETLTPIPAPGTLIVDYRAQGRWYRLRDDGHGQLVGNSAGVGTGSVDYVTGATVVTLGALPDVESSLLYAWGTPAHYEILADDFGAVKKSFQLDFAPVAPGSIVLSWAEGGVTKSASDDGEGGLIGDCGGTVDYSAARVDANLARNPDGLVEVDYDRLTDTQTDATAGTSWAIGHAIEPYSVQVAYNATWPDGTTSVGLYAASDDGVGNLRFSTRSAGKHAINQTTLVLGSTILGSVNYATGEITLNGTLSVIQRQWNNVFGWVEVGTGTAVLSGTSARAARSATATPQTFNVAADHALSIQFGQAVPMYIVPGSVMFRAAGRTYVDRNGTLYTDIDYVTGSGTEAGSIDYATGAVSLTLVNTDQPLALEVLSCLGRYGEWTMTAARFRTPGSPLRPASFYVQASTPGGSLLTATADANGVLSGSIGVSGAVQQTMGVASVDWGQAVMPSTLRFSCVVQTSLPLDADLLGLDPVRLPSDGRVAIYRPGDVCLVHDTQLYTLPNPAVASATYNVGRTDLSLLELIDAAGVDVPTGKYITDLVAGTVTMAADLDLTGYMQPLRARHRIEDMVLLADVQINGEIALTAPLTHDYTTDSLLSSALLFGDLQAYVTTLFDQQTWTGEWSDTLIGSQANAEYDDLNYPVEVLNESAVKERWRIHFTTSTTLQLYGENLGLIATGDTSTDLAPINAITGDPYFVLRAAGWGAGWAAGVNLRFNTEAGSAPIWIARTVLAGATLEGDSFDLAVRGDVD
jgi:hypothetical protein